MGQAGRAYEKRSRRLRLARQWKVLVCAVHNTHGVRRREVHEMQAVVGVKPDIRDKQIGRLGAEPGASVPKIGTDLDHRRGAQSLLRRPLDLGVRIDDEDLFGVAGQVRWRRDRIIGLMVARVPGDLAATPRSPHRYRDWLRRPTGDFHHHALPPTRLLDGAIEPALGSKGAGAAERYTAQKKVVK